MNDIVVRTLKSRLLEIEDRVNDGKDRLRYLEEDIRSTKKWLDEALTSKAELEKAISELLK